MRKKVFSIAAALSLASCIAVSSTDAATHTVKSGDTLWNVAKQYKMSVDELKSLNNLTTDTIKLNQKLHVSSSSKPAAPSKGTVGQPVSADKLATSSINSWANTKEPAAPAKPAQKPAAVPSSSMQAAAVKIAMPLLDTPYVWGGVTEAGFDCSGFLYYVYTKAGHSIPRLDTVGMYNQSSAVSDPVPGDLLFFENTYRKGISHAGIYLGDGKFIHAGTSKVEISSVDFPYWKEKFVGYQRFNAVK